MTRVFVDVPIDVPSLSRIQEMDAVEVTVAAPILEEEVCRPASQIRNVEVAFCTYLPVNHENMDQLRWVQLASSGYSQIVPKNLPSRAVRTTNARGVFDTAIAEWNVAMMICLARNLRQMIRNQESQIWDRAAGFQNEIRGATVGFWGYGGIARQTARICKSLGLTIYALTRSGIQRRTNTYRVPMSDDQEDVLPDRVFTLDREHEFLRTLDFLILCTPLNPETAGMVGEAELRSLPRTAFLLNPARGPLVQETALIQALCDGWIAGAAIDTHYQYPLPADHPLWQFRNVILTPHISGSSQGPYFKERVWDLFLQNLKSYVNGGRLMNELSPEDLTPRTS